MSLIVIPEPVGYCQLTDELSFDFNDVPKLGRHSTDGNGLGTDIL